MKIAIVGYGRMGRTVESLAPEMEIEVVARIEAGDAIEGSAFDGAEVAVEFTVPGSAPDTLAALARAGVPAVSGTTGWYDRLPEVRKAVQSSGTALLFAPNFSIGVALFRRMVRHAAALVDPVEDYDLHLHEAHHRHKVDHPSGTAVALAEDVLGASTRKRRWAEDPRDGGGDPEILGVSVERHGSVPGTHELALDGPDDRIVLRHEARSRDGFARGALTAARWIRGRAGVFTLEDMLDDRLGGSNDR